VPAGRVLGVIGPNGSGKTTLMRILGGLLRPTAGSAEVHGHDVRRLRRDAGFGVGYMPQQGGIYPELTVRQNVAFLARLNGLKGPERREAVEGVLDMVSLRDRAHERASKLSGGMQRRLSLACALVHGPGLLLLDEPTVGVDPELRSDIWGRLHGVAGDGALVLVSTHDMGEAMRCDSVLLLREGHAMALGPPAKLLEATGASDLEAAYLVLARRHRGEGP
jgi:ABC-2 type transport system ATP-binding protein